MAVVVIVSLSVLTAAGTFVESNYDAEAAGKLVYRTFWMWGALLLLAINLIAVMVDRWPWKKKHIPFLFAHVGILLILIGSWMTQKWGVDGHMRVEIGSTSRHLILPETDLVVYRSEDGVDFRKIYQKEVDFYIHPPTPEKPEVVPTGGPKLEVIEYKPYVVAQKKIVASTDTTLGAAVRFQLQNDRLTEVNWLLQSYLLDSASQDFGPLRVHLTTEVQRQPGTNEVFFLPQGNHLQFVIFGKESDQPLREGKLDESEEIALPWMGLKLKVLRFVPTAEGLWEITEKPRPTPMTTAAVKVRHADHERWLVLDDILRLNSSGALLRFVYSHRRVPMKKELTLKRFEVEKYQGSSKAMAYKSLVEVPGEGEHLISMNEPLKLDGLLYYQASFEDGPQGQPIASIFSINYDPGRWIKYLGSLVMSLGIILLFYFRKFYLFKNT